MLMVMRFQQGGRAALRNRIALLRTPNAAEYVQLLDVAHVLTTDDDLVLPVVRDIGEDVRLCDCPGAQCAGCPLCRYHEKHPPDEDDHIFRLRLFNDQEIAEMGLAIFSFGSVQAVARWVPGPASPFLYRRRSTRR
jgi:hypothetical protein